MADIRALRAAEEFNRFAERNGAPNRCDPSLSFVAPQLAQALGVWREKCKGLAMPSRRDLDARALKPFLPHVCIIDVVEENNNRRYRVRVMGTSLAGLLGDLTGKFFDEALSPPFRERWSAMIDCAVAAGCPLRHAGRVEFKGMHYLSMELLLAPIGQRGDAAESVLLVAYTSSSAPHVFDPLVKKTVSTATPV